VSGMHIVSFSGGKDSTAMLLMMIEKGIKIDRIINVDTTKEFDEMYEHIERVKEYIRPYTIETVRIDFDYWFSEHVKRSGTRGNGWPSFMRRWCTRIKIEALKHIITGKEYNNKKRSSPTMPKNIIEYHGVAADEVNRIKLGVQYPLVAWGMTEEDCLSYCYKKGFRWGGLYEKMSRVSCWCCPLSRMGELKVLYDDYPEKWKELQEMDKKQTFRFSTRYTVQQLTERFRGERDNEP
jgi:3'-phosphoadenosine 5'-phosphosulfate sulfotransferase (PAPS reductase)/FAD synthetase